MVNVVNFIMYILPQFFKSKKKNQVYLLFISLYYVMFKPHFLCPGFGRQSCGWLGDGQVTELPTAPYREPCFV